MSLFAANSFYHRIFVNKTSPMRRERYKLKATSHFTTYNFVSKGPKGHIPKLIKYSEKEVDARIEEIKSTAKV